MTVIATMGQPKVVPISSPSEIIVFFLSFSVFVVFVLYSKFFVCFALMSLSYRPGRMTSVIGNLLCFFVHDFRKN